MEQMITLIRNTGIVPVLVLEDEKDAVPVAGALRDGGIYCVEVTFRTEAAAEGIRKMREAFPDMLIGAGTVLDTDQVDAAVEAGAEFIVSPGYDEKVILYCREKGIFMVPGVSSPTEVEMACCLGLKLVKFFPAEAAGGVEMIKALSAPFGSMMFMPTGGINRNNLRKYLDCPKVIACGGSWMVDKELIRNKQFAEITKFSEEAMKDVLDFRLQHVGINGEGADDASKTADDFCGIFGFEKLEKSKSVFAGTVVEVMKADGFGKNGHIAIGTQDVERAKYFLEKRGIRFREESADCKEGKMVCIYLEKEIAGFAVHLVKN